ncbi:hypothetical protein KY290_018580 [Solanum tuberosum]|uniref:Uncharacterized protein n=1 Tax=Solanum tuberosum TaxID=4113 RepID=A0ABQ7VEL9_SOLTU|nr:hypothetical protein KY290_018580 [Solanum tuberosum]
MYVLNSVKSFIVEEEYIKKIYPQVPSKTKQVHHGYQSHSKHLMIWNCRGSEHSDFRVSFRSMLDYYRPTMVLLLDTQMTHHQHLPDDFSFGNIAIVPAIEGCGGMALVWKKEFVAVDGLVINSEEIHCTINVQ